MAKGDAVGGATTQKQRQKQRKQDQRLDQRQKKQDQRARQKLRNAGTWDPVGGATVNPFEGGYFDENSTYGADQNIAGATRPASGKDPKDMNRKQRQRYRERQRAQRQRDTGATDNVFTQDEISFSNTDPESWAKTWLGGQAGGGLAVDPNSAFGNWFDNELQNIVGSWQQAAGEGVNPNLSFASFLQTLGMPGGSTATDLLRQRWRAALPSQTGYSESANGAGPTRWSVW